MPAPGVERDVSRVVIIAAKVEPNLDHVIFNNNRRSAKATVWTMLGLRISSGCSTASCYNRRIKAKLKGLPPAIHRQQTTSIGYLFQSDSVTLSDEDCLDIYRASYK